MPFILLAGVAVCIYILVLMNRSSQARAATDDVSGAVSEASDEPMADGQDGGDGSGEGELPAVTRAEMAEMIDSLIEQYEEEIREMTPAQQKTRKESWETFEKTQSMTQMEFSEGVIARFWGFEPGSTPEIPNTKKLRLARGVWFTNPQASNDNA